MRRESKLHIRVRGHKGRGLSYAPLRVRYQVCHRRPYRVNQTSLTWCDSVHSHWAIPKGNHPDALINTFKPIPQLLLPDLDVSLIILRPNDMGYLTPVNDPWYNSTLGPINHTYPMGRIPLYISNQPAAVLACAQKYQFCNPSLSSNESCTPFLGIWEAFRLAPSLFPGTEARDNFIWHASAIANMANGLTELALALKQQALLASESSSTFGQYGLPDNQW